MYKVQFKLVTRFLITEQTYFWRETSRTRCKVLRERHTRTKGLETQATDSDSALVKQEKS